MDDIVSKYFYLFLPVTIHNFSIPYFITEDPLMQKSNACTRPEHICEEEYIKVAGGNLFKNLDINGGKGTHFLFWKSNRLIFISMIVLPILYAMIGYN
jgi:hypothetical protein